MMFTVLFVDDNEEEMSLYYKNPLADLKEFGEDSPTFSVCHNDPTSGIQQVSIKLFDQIVSTVNLPFSLM